MRSGRKIYWELNLQQKNWERILEHIVQNMRRRNNKNITILLVYVNVTSFDEKDCIHTWKGMIVKI